MGVTSTEPTSRRGYLSKGELEQYSGLTGTDDNIISKAEELIDAWIGRQDKYMDYDVKGLAAAAGATSLTLEASQQNQYDIDFFKLCEIEILGGTGAGQRRKITGSTKAGVLTVDDAWTVNPSTDSFYKIYQLGKFPRKQDVETYTSGVNTTYYKTIPEAVKRAVAAEYEYINTMGDAFFVGDSSGETSEKIGDYAYTTGGEAATNLSDLISPKSKMLLKGIYNRTGTLIA